MTVRYADPALLPGLRDALRAMLTSDTSTWQAPDSDITEALAEVGQLRQLLEVAEVALVREGLVRGLPTEQSWSPHDWVGVTEGRRAPRPTRRHLASVVRVARAAAGDGVGAAVGADPGSVDGSAEEPATGVPAVVQAFTEGDISVSTSDQLVRYHESVRRVADPQLLEQDLGHLLREARDELVASGPDGYLTERVPGLDERKLAAAITMTGQMLRPDRDIADEAERQRASRSLVKSKGPCGMTRYRVDLDPEGAVIIDSALAAWSKPAPGPDGATDDRSPTRRNADALVDIVGRGVESPDAVTTTARAQVVVTMSLAALVDDLGGTSLLASCGHTGGVTATGEVLSAAAARTLACDAQIIPAVLGSKGETLEMGRATRFFTPAQRRLMWQRDGGCTFPGAPCPRSGPRPTT